jgi:hypothetical protein
MGGRLGRQRSYAVTGVRPVQPGARRGPRREAMLHERPLCRADAYNGDGVTEKTGGGDFLRITALHCTALHCTALHCTALHCTALHCTELHCPALHCTALYSTARCTHSVSDRPIEIQRRPRGIPAPRRPRWNPSVVGSCSLSSHFPTTRPRSSGKGLLALVSSCWASQ